MKFPEQYRWLDPPDPRYSTITGDPFGAFRVPATKAPGRRQLNIIASDGQDVGWDHVSVTLDQSKNTPTWGEMDFVKDLFWDETETVMQLHVPKSDHICNHPGCLHLWRPTRETIPLPPGILVGIKSLGEIKP